MRDVNSCDPGYTKLSRYTKLSLSSDLRASRVLRVSAMHPFLFYGSTACLCIIPIISGICIFFVSVLFSFHVVVFTLFFLFF